MHNAAACVAARALGSEVQVRGLGLPVVDLLAVHLRRARALIPRDAARRAHDIYRQAARPRDAHRAGRARLRRAREHGLEQLGEQKGPEAVCAHLQLVAVRVARARRRHHDACVVGQHVEALLAGLKLGCRAGDGGEVRKVELKEVHGAARRGRVRLERLESAGGLAGIATGDVNGRVGVVEDLRELKPDAGVAASDDVDLGVVLDVRGGFRVYPQEVRRTLPL